MSLRLRAVLLSAAVGLACGCLLDNPLYDGAFTDSDASTRVTTGSTGTPTTDAPTSAGTDPTGSDSDDSVTTTDAPTTDTATTDTTLDTVDILADQAGCLGLPKGNQGLVLAVDCEVESSVGNGHGDLGEMVVDLVNGDFKDRETRSFLRFPWPAALDGAQIVAVELLLTAPITTARRRAISLVRSGRARPSTSTWSSTSRRWSTRRSPPIRAPSI